MDTLIGKNLDILLTSFVASTVAFPAYIRIDLAPPQDNQDIHERLIGISFPETYLDAKTARTSRRTPCCLGRAMHRPDSSNQSSSYGTITGVTHWLIVFGNFPQRIRRQAAQGAICLLRLLCRRLHPATSGFTRCHGMLELEDGTGRDRILDDVGSHTIPCIASRRKISYARLYNERNSLHHALPSVAWSAAGVE